MNHYTKTYLSLSAGNAVIWMLFASIFFNEYITLAVGVFAFCFSWLGFSFAYMAGVRLGE